MIYSVKFIKETKHQFNYLSPSSSNEQVQTLVSKLSKGIKFSKGINILVGENGCGKSTVLNIIKASNKLEHSFIPKPDFLPTTTIETLSEIYNSFEIKQDFRYFSANLYKMSDDEEKLVSNELDTVDEVSQFIGLRTASRGQNIMGDINQLFHQIFTKTSECYSIMYWIQKLKQDSRCNQEKLNELVNMVFENHLESNEMQITILMDEPDTNLDISNLNEVYNIISHYRDDTQLIAVIHNPILIYKLAKLDYVNIIELSDGYLNRVKQFVEN